MSAVLLAGNAVRWAASQPRDADVPLTEVLRTLLAACPRSRLRTSRVIAAVGPAASQLKRLTDLPPLPDARALAAVVREQAGRFFLSNGVPLVISGVYIESAARVWVAAFDAPVVSDIVAACRRAGFPLDTIVPSAVVLRWATDDTAITWVDGDVRLEITYAQHGLADVRRILTVETPAPMPAVATRLAARGETARDMLDAAGAARMRANEAVVVRVRDLDTPTLPTRRRLMHAAVACAMATCLALVSPGIAASVVGRRAQARESVLGARVRVAAREVRALGQTSAALSALATFSRAHQSMSVLLAEITRALPDSSTLIAWQVDSAGLGSVAGIAPHAAAIVDAVERVPALVSPEIMGPVTRELIGGRTVERVTVRFRVLPLEAP